MAIRSGISTPPKASVIAITAIAIAIFVGMWTGSAVIDERIVTLRYLLLILSAMIAFATPYLLFPDKNIALIQIGNLNNIQIGKYLLNKGVRISWPVFFLMAAVLFLDLNNPVQDLWLKSISLLNGILFYSAITLFAASRYLKSGFDSQFWQESEKGRSFRKQMADYFKYPIDPGSVPSLINTVVVLILGSFIAIIASVIYHQAGTAWEFVLMILTLAGSYTYYQSFKSRVTINFYSTNAFFLEFFGSSIKGEEFATRREVNQLWWVPQRLKAHVWQFLVQLDRKIPAGRVIAAGHIFVWMIAYQRPDPTVMAYIWLLFALSHHLFVFMTFGADVSPGWLHRWLGSAKIWLLSRFWMQLRWVVPLLLSMNLQLFVFGTPDFTIQGSILILFIITSWIVSMFGIAGLKKESS